MSIETEIQGSIRAKKKSSTNKSQHWLDSSTDMSDSDLDFSGNFPSAATSRPQKFKNAFATYKLATANKMHIGKNSEPIRLLHGFTHVEIALKAQINVNKNIGGGGLQMPPPVTKLCHPS